MAAKVSPAEVRVSIGRPIDLLPPDIRRAILERAALLAIGIVKRRTNKGLDVDGVPFLPYSPAYAKLRAESGRSTKPNLVLSGATLNGLAVLSLTDELVLVGFTGTAPATSFSGKRKARKIRQLTDEQLDNAVTVRAYKPRPARSVRKSKSATISNALKAKYLTEGNKRGKPPKPRPFLGISATERGTLVRDAQRFVKGLASSEPTP